jgi:hypothetical protein
VSPEETQRQRMMRQQRRKALRAEIAALKARYDAEDERLAVELLRHEKHAKEAARRAEQAYRVGGVPPLT